MRRITGRYLKEKWRIPAKHVLYREDGRWFHHLDHFPGALCDSKGYVLFESREAYERHPGLSHGIQLNVDGGISSLPGYRRME